MNNGFLKDSLFQLLLVYVILLFLVAFGFFDKFALHFEFFALILALIAFFLFWKEKKEEIVGKESKLWAYLIIASFAVLLISRIVPVVLNNVPLGYDFGIYKFAFEQHAKAFPNIYSAEIPNWVSLWSPLGIYLVSDMLSLTSLKPEQFLTPLIVIFELLLGIALYYCAKEYFGKKPAILSLFFYSISIIQFKTFKLFYLKNILGLALLLAAFYFLKRKKSIPLILSAGFLSGVHRPTFLIFAIVFAVYFIANLKEWRKNLVNGLGVFAFVALFYWNNFQEAVLGYFVPSIEAPAGGQFINFFTFQFSTLFYLPFAVLALLLLLKSRQNIELSITAVFLFAVTFFQLFFYNRYLIHLDIFLVLFAGFGVWKVFSQDYNKILKHFLVVLFFLAVLISLFSVVFEANSLISASEFEFIKKIPKITELNSSILVTSSYYSPLVLGFSERKTIMPCLFGSDEWNYKGWQSFWDSNSAEEAVRMLSVYEKPLYVFNGEFSQINREKFNNDCFETVAEGSNSSLIRVKC